MHGKSPVFVLVHGAWHGAWCWHLVADLLRARGYRVFTPTLTGSGDRRHLASLASLDVYVEDVRNLIEAEELDDIVLVGHSMAGIVVPHVAQEMPSRIRHLILLAAVVLNDGESELDVMTAGARETYLALARASGTDSVPLSANDARLSLVQNAPSQLQDWVVRRLTPQPLEPWRASAHLRSFYTSDILTTYIHCDQDRGMGTPGKPSEWLPYARKLETLRNFAFVTFHSDHEPMISQPDAITDLFIQIGNGDGSIRELRRSVSSISADTQI